MGGSLYVRCGGFGLEDYGVGVLIEVAVLGAE